MNTNADYIFTTGSEHFIKIRAKEDNFKQTLHFTITVDDTVVRKSRSFAKLAEKMGDVDAATKVTTDVLVAATGISAEQLGEIPLLLAEEAMLNSASVTIQTVC